MNRTHGFTLVELLVVLAILSISAGTTFLALRPPQSEDDSLHDRISQARGKAIRSGVPVRIEIPVQDDSTTSAFILFLPDGRAIGPGVDPWTGVSLVRK